MGGEEGEAGGEGGGHGEASVEGGGCGEAEGEKEPLELREKEERE